MVKTYEEMKAWINEEPGERFFCCPKCEGTDKWCILEMDDERGAVCERHGVIVPNAKFSGERSEFAGTLG